MKLKLISNLYSSFVFVYITNMLECVEETKVIKEHILQIHLDY